MVPKRRCAGGPGWGSQGVEELTGKVAAATAAPSAWNELDRERSELPEDEPRRAAVERSERAPARARAERALRQALLELGLRDREVGRLRRIGEGLARTAFAAEIDCGVDRGPRELVALVPRGPRSAQREEALRREARLLTLLAARELPFRVPRIAVCVTSAATQRSCANASSA